MSKKLGLIPKENLIKRIGAAYSGAARSVVAILRDLDPMTYTDAEGSEALSKIRRVVAGLDEMATAWAVKSIKAAYAESRSVSRTRLEAIGAEQTNVKKGRHEKAIQRMAKLTIRDYLDANRTILKNAGKYLSVMAHAKRKMDRYRENVRAEAFSSAEVRDIIDDVVKAATGAHLPSKGVSRQILDKLLDQISGGDFITVNGRNFEIRSYAELVARTRMRMAQTEAVKEMCAEWDNDLVEFSRHDDPCDICAPLEGQVFSISGKTPGYEKLTPEVTPPIHPNCEHSLNPTSERALRLRNR